MNNVIQANQNLDDFVIEEQLLEEAKRTMYSFAVESRCFRLDRWQRDGHGADYLKKSDLLEESYGTDIYQWLKETVSHLNGWDSMEDKTLWIAKIVIAQYKSREFEKSENETLDDLDYPIVGLGETSFLDHGVETVVSVEVDLENYSLAVFGSVDDGQEEKKTALIERDYETLDKLLDQELVNLNFQDLTENEVVDSWREKVSFLVAFKAPKNKQQFEESLLDYLEKNDLFLQDGYFTVYTDAGGEFSVPYLGDTVFSLERWLDSFDVSEEAMLWLDSSGHGTNGAPYDMKEVYEDIEGLRDKVQALANECIGFQRTFKRLQNERGGMTL